MYTSSHPTAHLRTLHLGLLIAAVLLAGTLLAACGNAGGAATRTPVPTWTPTVGAPPAPGDAAAAPSAQVATVAPPVAAPVVVQADTPAPPTPLPPTPVPATPEPPTAIPTETPTSPPTNTPTETPSPATTATPYFAFALEAAEKFPTQALAPNVVRVWMYVYSPAALGLGGYSLQVKHNGAPLVVDEVSTEGLPGATFDTPGPYTRFQNFNVLFVEAQAGTWDVQLVDAAGAPAGPPAQFVLSADEATRELYVRYKQVGALP